MGRLVSGSLKNSEIARHIMRMKAKYDVGYFLACFSAMQDVIRAPYFLACVTEHNQSWERNIRISLEIAGQVRTN